MPKWFIIFDTDNCTMKRKDFLKKAGQVTIGAGIIASGLASCKKDDEIVIEEDCSITPSDAAGPFYVASSSEVVNLNTQNLSGSPMLLTGTVYSNEGTTTPIEGAKVELWHADDIGGYHPEGSGDVSDYEPAEITLRGFVLTDSNGAFSVSSILPGLYGSRARHIHYKITVDGHKELTTQSYFFGDDRIPYDELSSNAGDCRIIDFTDNNGTLEGSITINLERT